MLPRYLEPQVELKAGLTEIKYTPCDCDLTLVAAELSLRIKRAGDDESPQLVYTGAVLGEFDEITFTLDAEIFKLKRGYYHMTIENQDGFVIGALQLVNLPQRSSAASIPINCGP